MAALLESTTFNVPAGLAYNATGQSIVVADSGNSIVRSIFLTNVINLSGTAGTTTSVLFNPVTLIAGTGACGNTTDNNASAPLTQLCNATGVAVGPAQNIFIADTGNAAIRLVSNGLISTIAGVLSGPGSGVVPGSAANVQFTSPSAIAASANGVLQIVDAGNNRVLTDQRSQVSFNFGRTNLGFSSPVQTFIESSAGTVTATLATPLLTPSAVQTQFTLAPASGSAGCTTGAFAVGATCLLQGQFTPAAQGNFSVTYTEVGTNVAGGDPAITLLGTGAVLTPTTGTVSQTNPATGNSQFGGSVTLTATITPNACKTAAPNCYPTGTVRFIVDGGNPGSPITLVGGTTSSSAAQVVAGLSTGNHTISCNYSGDDFYAASTCATTTITVATATTTSLLSATNNNQPQFTTSVLTATVVSTTSGIPTGTVSFYANGTLLGTTPVNATNGVATFTMQETLGPDGNPTFNNTLVPGTYTLTCTYSGSANFSASNCAGVTFTVLASPVAFALTSRGCQATSLIPSGSQIPSLAIPCTVANFISGVPLVAVAQGSTSDVTIFVSPSNTASGTFTFACSGLPKASTCTFSPTTLTFTAGTAPASPVAVDMTLWTDLQPGVGNASLRTNSNISVALLWGWPITLLGLAGIFRFRRKANLRGISLLAPGADAYCRLLTHLHRLRRRRSGSLPAQPHPSRDLPDYNHRHRRRRHAHHNRLLDSHQPRPPRPAVGYSHHKQGQPAEAALAFCLSFPQWNLRLPSCFCSCSCPSCCHPRRGSASSVVVACSRLNHHNPGWPSAASISPGHTIPYPLPSIPCFKVPPLHHPRLPLKPDYAQTPRPQRKLRPSGSRQSNPPRRQNPQNMRMRKQRHTPSNPPRARNHLIRTVPHGFHCLSANYRRSPHAPIRTPDRPHLGSRLALRIPVVPLLQIILDDRDVPKPSNRTSLPCAFHRANKHRIELPPRQKSLQRRGLLAPTVSQRNVRRTRMLPTRTPLCLSMPHQPDCNAHTPPQFLSIMLSALRAVFRSVHE